MNFIKLLFFVFFSSQLHAEIAIQELKNTFNIVAPEYKQCSPLEGMIWWETGIIKNIYRIGNPDHATTKLVKELFHLHNDGIFDCARPPANVANSGKAAAYFTPEIIAEFIGYLETYKTEAQINELKNKIKSAKYVKEFLERYKDAFPAQGNYISNLKKIFGLISDSYLECLPNNPKSPYMVYTVHHILLAYLWKKLSSQDDIIRYFKAFATSTNAIAIIPSRHQDSLDTMLIKKYSREELLDFLNQMQNKTADDLLNENEYERDVCAVLLNKPLEMISHASGVKYKNEEFPDCGEVSLLNFFNQIVFNKETGMFDVSLLESQGIKVNQKLKDFYAKYKFPADMKTKQVHNDWALVVSEIPGVTYRQGGTQVNEEVNPPHYCNIAGEGYEQMTKVLHDLIGIDSLADISKLSRVNFKLSCTPQEPLEEPFNTFTISINNEACLEWVSSWGHFQLISIENTTQTHVLPIQIIQGLLLLPLDDSPRACSLLTLTQNAMLFEKLISDNKLPSLSCFNFSCLLPRIDNADDAVDFLTILATQLNRVYANYHDLVIELIMRIYQQLPIDPHYVVILANLVIQNRITNLYNFLFDQVQSFSNDSFHYAFLRETIMEVIVKSRNESLYTKVKEIFDSLDSSGFGRQVFIQKFIMLIGEKQIDEQVWRDFINKKFTSLGIDVQTYIITFLMGNRLTDWYSLIVQYFNAFDWAKYQPPLTFDDNSLISLRRISPQEAFSVLLESADPKIQEWLQMHFKYMSGFNKQKALEVFSTMSDWPTWIQNNFVSLAAVGNRHDWEESLDITALKILIKQHDPVMTQFIEREVSKLNSSKIFSIFDFILEHNYDNFFGLIKTNFEKLKRQDLYTQQDLCQDIILYNRINLFSVVEDFLSRADDRVKAYVLNNIVSSKYKFDDGTVSMTPQKEIFFGQHPESGELIPAELYSKWYPLVSEWLLKITDDNQAMHVIEKIEKNNITELSDIAQQRKDLIKPLPTMPDIAQ